MLNRRKYSSVMVIENIAATISPRREVVAVRSASSLWLLADQVRQILDSLESRFDLDTVQCVRLFKLSGPHQSHLAVNIVEVGGGNVAQHLQARRVLLSLREFAGDAKDRALSASEVSLRLKTDFTAYFGFPFQAVDAIDVCLQLSDGDLHPAHIFGLVKKRHTRENQSPRD
jgi:hypothetical protein